MLKRIAIVIYIFLNIPLIIIPIFTIWNSNFWNDLNIKTYQARCHKNDKLVVLQGSMNDLPYTFNSRILNNRQLETRENLRFYCENYDEIQKHIINYRNAQTENEKVTANLAFWNFEKQKQNIYVDNFSLETIDSKSDFYPLSTSVISSIVYVVLYFSLIQTLRIIYQYVVFGKFNWHPYKRMLQKDRKEDKN